MNVLRYLVRIAKSVSLLLFFAGAAALAQTPSQNSQQGLRIGQWSGDVQLLGDYARTNTSSFGIGRKNENARVEEQISLSNTGSYVIDPRFMSFLLGGTFGLSQELTTTGLDGQQLQNEERNADLLGYVASASLFSDSALSMNLYSNRNKYSMRRQFAGRIDTDTQNTGASINAKRFYIPSTLSVRQEHAKEESRVADISSQRDELRNVVTYDARRGWIDSEMVLRYEFVDKADVYRPQLDYDSQTANMSYSLDFGPELNRRWDSRLRGSKRRGYSEERRYDVDELIRLDHTKNLRSQYRYFITGTTRPQGDSTSRTAEFNVRHQLYESLTTGFLVNAINNNLSGGKKNVYASRLSFDYTKRTSGNGRLLIGLTGYYAREDDQFDVLNAQFLQEEIVFDEPFARPVALENSFVLVSSISVSRTALGTTSGCDIERPLVEGIDYEARTSGNITEIVPLGDCATDPTVGVGPGDTIAVDYQAEVPGQLAFTSTSWRFNTALDYGWIRPFFIHDEQYQQLDEGAAQQEQFLQNHQSDIAGIELRHSGLRTAASVSIEAERYQSRDQAYLAVRGNEFLQFLMSSSLQMNLTTRQSVTEFSAPEDRRTEFVEARATLRYIVGAGINTELLASWRFIRDTIVPDEEIREAGAQLSWRLGKLDINPSLHYINRTRDASDLHDYRAVVRAIRRF